jgi:hypothetical protein
MPQYIKCPDIADLSSIASAVGSKVWAHANERGVSANTRFEVGVTDRLSTMGRADGVELIEWAILRLSG